LRPSRQRQHLSEDSLLAALAQEVRELKSSVHSALHPVRQHVQWQTIPTIKKILRSNPIRKELYSYFVSKGGTASTWPKILKAKVTDDFAKDAASWDEAKWKTYIDNHLKDIVLIDTPRVAPQETPSDTPTPEHVQIVKVADDIDEELIERVKNSLPAQPWPKGVHRKIIADLSIKKRQYDKVIVELMKRKVFHQQIDGILLDTDD
jgi:hypothetical protein